jgi:kynureninase
MKRRTLEEITALDRDDPLREKRSAFEISEDVIYLDGNSLGVLPKAVPALMDTVVTQQWGDSLIRGWSEHGWMDLPSRVGNKIGHLIGAQPGTVIVADSTSVNLFKLLAAALALRPRRKVILSDSGNFPTDLHIAQGLRDLLERNHELKLVEPDKIENAIDKSVAVLMLTEVDYKTGFKHDMARLTGSAHDAGALTLWDLAHSTGAFPVDLTAAKVDFAVGCGYKYLNGGPGAPAFLYIAPKYRTK